MYRVHSRASAPTDAADTLDKITQAWGFLPNLGAVLAESPAALELLWVAYGVLSTKGRQTQIYPEDQLTFRTLAAVPISTDQAAHAFQPVRQEDYSPTQLQQRVQRQTTAWGPSPFFYDPFWGGGYGYHGRSGYF